MRSCKVQATQLSSRAVVPRFRNSYGNPHLINWRAPPRRRTPLASATFDASLLEDPSITVLPANRLARGLGAHTLLFKPPAASADSQIPSSPFGIRMLNWVQLITTPTADTGGTSILLHFDNQRYVFGRVGEGTQRAMVQRKVALNKVEDFFISGVVNWQNCGGLLGAILTLADILSSARENSQAQQAEKKKKKAAKTSLVSDTTISRLSLHGGKNLTHLLATSRRFIFRKGLPLKPHEIRDDPRAVNDANNEPDYQDNNIKVWYMPVESDQATPGSRKRSHDEFNGSESAPTQKGRSAPASEETPELVETVVTQMFNSDWSMDALVETTLHKAKLPAKIFVRDQNGHIQVYTGPLPGGQTEVPDMPVLVRQPWPGAMVESLPPTKPSRHSMCYITRGHDRRGKFNPKEAEKYGVAKVDYKLLTSGQNATGKDGVVVTPDMVLDETVPGKGFAVIDLPDSSFVDSLVKRSEWSNDEIMKGICVIFWILGPGVVHDARIQQFMAGKAEIRHIVSAPDTSPNMLALESVATQAFKLHSIDPDRFPLPQFTNDRSLSGSPTMSTTSTFEVGRTGKTVQFAPTFLHQDDKVVPFPDIQKLASNDLGKDVRSEVEQLTQEARARIADPEFLAKIEKVESNIPNRDAEIITLGTGSALPSKYRNVSATLVRVPGYGNYLFDCGENTLGQLQRVFGNELPAVMRDLKAIWISHLHADHHLGTASVIRSWNEETLKFEATSDVEDYGYSRIVPSVFQAAGPGAKICRPHQLTTQQTAAFGLQEIRACFVSHCFGAMATVFEWPSGLKIAYSGDCRPSDAFVEIGRDSTVLIHESTFEDELQGDAVAKKHSTMGEAIAVGRRMNARRILLTHFSQRYQKIPLWEGDLDVTDGEEGMRSGTGDVGRKKRDEVILVGFDYMRVRVGDFRKAQAFLPTLQKLFEDVGHQ
jgi:ribonuclease Z